ncbi:hypothetical protein ABSA28_00104 [Candidatus Hepatincolaceae symbiont of Richtersius coronifer]
MKKILISLLLLISMIILLNKAQALTTKAKSNQLIILKDLITIAVIWDIILGSLAYNRSQVSALTLARIASNINVVSITGATPSSLNLKGDIGTASVINHTFVATLTVTPYAPLSSYTDNGTFKINY